MPYSLARDGKKITQSIIEMGKRGYESISGNEVKIDKNGDSEGSFTALGIKEHKYSMHKKSTNSSFKCSHYLMPVGKFKSIDNSPESKIGVEFEAENGGPEFVDTRPKDEPRCGFDGGGCKQNKGSTIAAAVLGTLLLFFCIVYVFWNRRIKVEQEIEGLLWRINLDCLQRGDRQVCLIFTQPLGHSFLIEVVQWRHHDVVVMHLRSFISFGQDPELDSMPTYFSSSSDFRIKVCLAV